MGPEDRSKLEEWKGVWTEGGGGEMSGVSHHDVNGKTDGVGGWFWKLREVSIATRRGKETGRGRGNCDV